MLMQPNQPERPDYNFIFNSPQPKRSLIAGGSLKQRLLIVGAGSLILVMLLLIGWSLLFGNTTSNTERLVGIAAQQKELVRIAATGLESASSAETRNFASTVSLSMASAQTETNALLSKQGRKVKEKELMVAGSAQTDEALTKAAQINQFDETFNNIIRTSLEKYQRDVKTAFDNSNSRSEKAALEKLYNSASTLAKTTPG